MSYDCFKSLPPADQELVEKYVNNIKSQGIFDQFRKDCQADVDTKPAYQNLQQRVENTVSKFLSSYKWQENLNKTQIREKLRKHVQKDYLENGVDRIVDQVVNPKIYSVFMPKVGDIVYESLGIERPKQPVELPKPPSLLMNKRPSVTIEPFEQVKESPAVTKPVSSHYETADESKDGDKLAEDRLMEHDDLEPVSTEEESLMDAVVEENSNTVTNDESGAVPLDGGTPEKQPNEDEAVNDDDDDNGEDEEDDDEDCSPAFEPIITSKDSKLSAGGLSEVSKEDGSVFSNLNEATVTAIEKKFDNFSNLDEKIKQCDVNLTERKLDDEPSNSSDSKTEEPSKEEETAVKEEKEEAAVKEEKEEAAKMTPKDETVKMISEDSVSSQGGGGGGSAKKHESSSSHRKSESSTADKKTHDSRDRGKPSSSSSRHKSSSSSRHHSSSRDRKDDHKSSRSSSSTRKDVKKDDRKEDKKDARKEDKKLEKKDDRKDEKRDKKDEKSTEKRKESSARSHDKKPPPDSRHSSSSRSSDRKPQSKDSKEKEDDEKKREAKKRRGERCDDGKSKNPRRSSDRDNNGGQGSSKSSRSTSTRKGSSSTSKDDKTEDSKEKSSNANDQQQQQDEMDKTDEVDLILMQINSQIERDEQRMLDCKKPKIANNFQEMKKVMKARKLMENSRRLSQTEENKENDDSENRPKPLDEDSKEKPLPEVSVVQKLADRRISALDKVEENESVFEPVDENSLSFLSDKATACSSPEEPFQGFDVDNEVSDREITSPYKKFIEDIVKGRKECFISLAKIETPSSPKTEDERPPIGNQENPEEPKISNIALEPANNPNPHDTANNLKEEDPLKKNSQKTSINPEEPPSVSEETFGPKTRNGDDVPVRPKTRNAKNQLLAKNNKCVADKNKTDDTKVTLKVKATLSRVQKSRMTSESTEEADEVQNTSGSSGQTVPSDDAKNKRKAHVDSSDNDESLTTSHNIVDKIAKKQKKPVACPQVDGSRLDNTNNNGGSQDKNKMEPTKRSSQRYDNEDLYKPRPVLSHHNSRRFRASNAEASDSNSPHIPLLSLRQRNRTR